ncbi:efflux RND transporter periplasmic adaptor subunit [soil metagenome]
MHSHLQDTMNLRRFVWMSGYAYVASDALFLQPLLLGLKPAGALREGGSFDRLRMSGAGAAACALLLALLASPADAADDKKPAAPKAALSVVVTTPQRADLPLRIRANGNIAAWQEASIGTEANGLRLADVKVNVGDVVKRGQVLATFAPATVQAEVAQNKAAVAEAEATLAEAAANAQRARGLKETGALSESVINQYLTAERTAQARLESQRALSQMQQLRLGQTRVLAPDAGVISSRTATVGAVLPAGQELFRMIRQGRLEWRAEVAATDMASLKPGMPVRITPVEGASIAGKVRIVAPTVDPQTRNGIVYVDMPAPGPARAGMFARGEFEIGSGSGLTLPQSAVTVRDGFSYVLRVGADSKVTQAKVNVGRRVGDRIEITGGLDATARVVAAGGGFLADGDTVRVVDAPPASAAPASASK